MILLNLVTLLMLIIAYMLYKDFMAYCYKQKLFDARTKLFIFALENGIDFDEKDYRYLELKINALLYYAEEKTMADFLIFNIFIRDKFIRLKRKYRVKDYEIQNEKLKKFNIELETSISSATMKHLGFGTLTGMVTAACIIIRIIGKAVLADVSVRKTYDENISNVSKLYEDKAIVDTTQKLKFALV